MNESAVKQRNLNLECCRMVAALFVVFLHVPFPGQIGGLVSCLSRFAVPLFFAISGYYSYQTAPGKLLRRMKRVLSLELAAIVMHQLWSCVLTASQGASLWDGLKIPAGGELLRWLLWNVDPFAGHLWYLSAAAYCYSILWLYTLCFRKRKTDYRLLYLIGGCLLAGHFAMAELSCYTGMHTEYMVYRSGWFLGIPMFAMGLFLRQYQQRLPEDRVKTVRRLALVLAGGVLMSIWEWRHFGGYDLPAGAVIQTGALLLLTAVYPEIPEKFRFLRKAAPRFGFLSTMVYIVHLVIQDAYRNFFAWKLEAAVGQWEGWAAPVAVALASVCVSAVILFLNIARKNLSKRIL